MNMADKHTAIPAAYVIFEREDGQILLLRRANTGYMDGKFQMPSGHIEAHELPSAAAIREAKEETGIDIAPEHLELAHISYRARAGEHADRADFFFRVRVWGGEPMNAEPHKCSELLWASPDNLPDDTVPIIAEVLGYIGKGVLFSEINGR